ncbi:hypothetical protein HK098_000802 [Nowakowskiella sp. JEL0407]|nr:hypothetical protein HK098_000802 [Nowakowskiella sp. JEL0407]
MSSQSSNLIPDLKEKLTESNTQKNNLQFKPSPSTKCITSNENIKPISRPSKSPFAQIPSGSALLPPLSLENKQSSNSSLSDKDLGIVSNKLSDQPELPLETLSRRNRSSSNSTEKLKSDATSGKIRGRSATAPESKAIEFKFKDSNDPSSELQKLLDSMPPMFAAGSPSKWPIQDFSEYPKYQAWRQKMLRILPKQIDYPLIFPPELLYLLKDDKKE